MRRSTSRGETAGDTLENPDRGTMNAGYLATVMRSLS
jgi:hypothetical protein